MPKRAAGESVFRSIALGVRYVFGDQILVGSMALDLFAVLFGGAIALLPAFAKDILHVGAGRFGLLNAAPSVGALVVMLWSTRHPPIKHAGRNLLLSVAGFGVSMIAFALSTNFWLSLAALAASGGFDGVSMVIRKSILRIMSPDHLRGRIAAVSSIFIGSSNEIGAFESGVAAKLLGTVRSVWLGGVVTLIVVAATAAVAPRLRRIDLSGPIDEIQC
jgi:MFS family permease